MKKVCRVLINLEKLALGAAFVMMGVNLSSDSLWVAGVFYVLGAIAAGWPAASLPASRVWGEGILAVIAAVALITGAGIWMWPVVALLAASLLGVAAILVETLPNPASVRE